jgi:predicted glycoside hydrolase/deacetylase ChbG (UPF0249 family)
MAKRLIINADDLGYDPEVTRGIVEAMQRGVVSSTTLMVNGPYSSDAAAHVKGTSLAVGLHVNLARWRPLWPGFPATLLEHGELAEPLSPSLPAEVVEREVSAQLGALESLIGRRATHIDVHKHLQRHPAVLEGVSAAAKAHRLPMRAIDETMRARIREKGIATTDAFLGDAGQEAYWTASRLEQALGSLPQGLTELMCHPGYAPSKVKSGYAEQRETELRTFLDAGLPKRLAELGIQLATF